MARRELFIYFQLCAPPVPRRIVSVDKNQKLVIFSADTMRRVLKPYLFSALKRCRRCEIPVCRPAIVRWVIGPLQWSNWAVAALQGRNWAVAACVGINRVREPRPAGSEATNHAVARLMPTLVTPDGKPSVLLREHPRHCLSRRCERTLAVREEAPSSARRCRRRRWHTVARPTFSIQTSIVRQLSVSVRRVRVSREVVP